MKNLGIGIHIPTQQGIELTPQHLIRQPCYQFQEVNNIILNKLKSYFSFILHHSPLLLELVVHILFLLVILVLHEQLKGMRSLSLLIELSLLFIS